MRLAVLTTGRQDYGILRSTLLLMKDHAGFDLRVWAGGMHLHESYGASVSLIREDGIRVDRELDFLAGSDGPVNQAASAAAAVGDAVGAESPDALLLVGDRSETLAAALAATVARVPLVHLHGGEESEGAIDNAFRHAITKLSHLHLVSHPRHAQRVVQMGENPESVHVVGAPGLDHLYRDDLPTRSEVEQSLGRRLGDPLVLVTMHPATLGAEPALEVAAVAAAMERVDAFFLITAPNSDEGGVEIRAFWQQWSAGRENALFVDALGGSRYWTLLRHAAVVLGNSSSGVIEAPAASVPVVNVGDRQGGRVRYGWVADVPGEPTAIEEALRAAILEGRSNDASGSGYPGGPSAPRVVEAITRWKPPVPPRKRFHDIA